MQVDGVLWSGIEESIYVLKSNGLVIDDDGFVMEMRRKLTDGKDTLQLCIHLKSDELLDVGKRFYVQKPAPENYRKTCYVIMNDSRIFVAQDGWVTFHDIASGEVADRLAGSFVFDCVSEDGNELMRIENGKFRELRYR